MMSKIDCDSGSASDEGILEDAYDLKIETSLGDEGIECLTDSIGGLQDSGVASYYSCRRSFSNDSGFNSDNESRDSIDGVLDICHDESDDECSLTAEMRQMRKSCQCLELKCDCLDNSSSDSLLQRNRNLARKLKSVVQPKCHEKPDLVHLNSRLGQVDSDNISYKSDISTKNQIASRRHRPVSAISPVVLEATTNLRATRRSRRAVQDLNNNDAGSRNLNSFLKKAPFKLQDCFHNKGLLSLVACIIYTLVLMVVIGILSMIMSYLKSYIGTQNLKTMRKNIVNHRRTRESMAAG